MFLSESVSASVSKNQKRVPSTQKQETKRLQDRLRLRNPSYRQARMILLDTQAWLWWLHDPSRFSDRARQIIAQAQLVNVNAA